MMRLKRFAMVAQVLLLGLPLAVSGAIAKPAIEKSSYGELDGQKVELYTLTNAKGLKMKVITYGAIITELHVPDRNSKLGDIVLGFDRLEDYVKGSPYFGATVGRVANRIRDAKFTLGGVEHKVAPNNAPHFLHGGKKGWDKVIWKAEPKDTPEGPSIRFTYVSKDGEEGFPGTVKTTAIYTLTHRNELKIRMEATTDKETLVSMAHHSYFNLAGHDSGTIEDQVLKLHASQYTPGDPMVPTGVIAPVKGTPFDFTSPKPIGRDLKAAGGDPAGYDLNFVVDGKADRMRPVFTIEDPKSGRVMTLEADQPGFLFYTGNFLDGSLKGKGGVTYPRYGGMCLESEKFPNAINVPAWKNQVILKPGKTYRHSMIFRFKM